LTVLCIKLHDVVPSWSAFNSALGIDVMRLTTEVDRGGSGALAHARLNEVVRVACWVSPRVAKW